MTTTNAVSAATGATTASAIAGSAAGATTRANDAADRFLTLLVTQLKNQDPLNPLDNAQLTSQLAQINTVNGINKLNETVASLAASIGASQSMQAVSLIGHDVVVAGNKLQVSGGAGAAGAFSLPAKATGATVTIRDAAGVTIRTLTLPAQNEGIARFAWDGKNDAGATAADGVYTFEVAATGSGGSITATPLSVARVTGLAAGANGLQLKLGALGTCDLSQVVELN